MNKIFRLALRNLSRQKRRSVILALAIAFGFFVVTAIDGLVSGAVNMLEEQITQMIGGSVIIQGYEKTLKEDGSGKYNLVEVIRDHDYITDLLEKNNINYKYSSRYTTSAGQVLFNSKRIISQVYGRDFKNDTDFISSLQFTKGGPENLSDPNAIILNEDVAKNLNIDIGDSLLYTTTTIYGQNNVGEFTLAATIKGTSLLSSSIAYAPIETVNNLVGMNDDGYTVYTLFLPNKKKQTAVAMQIENLIRADGIPVSNRIEAMQTNPTNVGNGINKQFNSDDYVWEGTKYSVETLNDMVPQIQQVMSVVHIVTTIILVVILLIVMVGISNTYRMVLYERIREIGTMRALGMRGKDTGRVFTTEALILCVIGAAAGLVLAIIVMILVGFINITNESVSFFLNKGHLTFTLSFVSILVQYIIMIVLTALAVHGTAKKAAHMSPAQALRTIK